ncbi:hypothetical protein PTSG_12881 [Salpingoeca rosetta]|uniref:Uncharacterized protein n=1 Tax=Salpingoeca rosetta (strain ATCC 50818 / BSB-021) TaxID=946362 RepID=F2UMK5_SALR5|nr:uncharacterized protein PTSG_12881 [Salpingoeca rosetta]EGD78354.1 hypothetical protein PTSG_12881 [Salpingoeca rosetta]|eukprot:XP_004989677.1 hypothetical protein PTSG_12881 [Salpingoeca rosetta]
MGGEQESGVSEYERLRQENIRRNLEKLQALDLLSSPSLTTGSASASTTTTASTTGSSSSSQQKEAGKKPPAPQLPRRRSQRLAQLKHRPSLKEPSVPRAPTSSKRRHEQADNSAEDADAQAKFWSKRPPHYTSDDASATAKTEQQARSAAHSAIANAKYGRVSCKQLRANVERMVLQHLGRSIPRIGGQVKRAVMELAAAPHSVTFNRMSGIQEWANAVFLFVNINPSGYDNVFLDGGRMLTWFAQPTQKPTTPVIVKLLQYGQMPILPPNGPVFATEKQGNTATQATVTTNAEVLSSLPHNSHDCASSTADADYDTAYEHTYDDGNDHHRQIDYRHYEVDGDVVRSLVDECVLLFCRLPGQDYVCLGRLRCEKTDLDARPMRFLWRLIDHGHLLRSPSFLQMLPAP